MAYTLYGCGTTFRANTPLLPDGTFITTKWIVLFFVPIIPLGSYRVKHLGSTSEFHLTGFSSTSEYQIIQRVPWDTREVVKFASYILAIIIVFIAINVFVK